MPAAALNVFGRPLAPCSVDPLTGWFRDGCCHTDPQDRGLHVVCVVVTADFLAFSRSRGNDLSTPRPEMQFPGLRPGDRWCLCALRWLEALQAGMAPDVVLESTHLNVLGVVGLDELKAYAVDAPA
jgi:uncharacterized protein (DUF2237 family)